MTLCDTFKQLAVDTWDDILKGRNVSYQLKEETLTDLNMLELKTKHPTEILTTVYNKRQEGSNGSDWEWWFNGISGRWIGFRVQAKIINIQTEEFEHLHYRNPTTHIYQCDKLIQHALNGVPKIPLYCFFIQTNNAAHLSNWPCGTVPRQKDLYGCSLTSAFTVRHLRSGNRKHLSDIDPSLKPWHCLVCCNNYGKSDDIVENIEAYAIQNFDLQNVGDFDVKLPEKFSTDDPPYYVRATTENQKKRNFEPPDKDIDGLVVFTQKKSKKQ